MASNEIVVGVDGSDPSFAATHWAAQEAHRRGATLRVVHAYEWAWPGAHFTNTPPAETAAREQADQLVAAAVTVANAAADVPVTGQAVRGRPAQTLIETARSADLLVVGSRGRGGFVNLLLGSISQQVATHAEVPVVVVPAPAGTADGPVVVGVDGSPGAEHALRLGFEAAALRGVQLLAIRTYYVPPVLRAYGVTPHVADTTEIEIAEQKGLDDAVASWRDAFPNVPVETRVVKGTTAEVLVNASETAQLVVVGTRGHGGFTGLLLGSVGQQLLHHTHSPVLIARAH
jgi:nucleotide-binding universal stress UspA family protein